MSQCVPSWDLDDNSAPSKIKYQPNSPQDVPSLDYEVAELTWENGQLSMHGLGVPRVFNKPTASSSPATWDKPRAGGTLESIVDQATLHHLPPKPGASKELAPWFDPHQHRAMVNPGSAAASVTVIMDALVPCNNGGRRHESRDGSAQVLDSVPAIGASRAAGCSTRVGSCSGAAAPVECGRRVVRVGVGVSSCRTSGSVSESATCGGRDSRQTMSIDTWERELGGPGFTSTSPISPENTISGQEYTRASADDRDSVSLHSMSQVYDRKAAGEEEGRRRENGKSSVCTKRSRAAAIHNQSERKRRDKINQRMKTLQKLVPNSSKSDKASMLDEVIEYLKQLQAQVHMMSRMNMPSMMLPLAMQQQMQMSMMGMSMRMGMGMGMGVMDIPRTPAVPLFMPVAAAAGWDNGGDCLTPPPPPASVMPDPLAALLGCQSQPMTMEAYSRMAAMYQQLQQQPGSKN